MGLPQYLRHIIQRYPGVASAKLPERISRLFVDFNGIIHQGAVNAKDDSDVIANTLQLTDKLIERVLPEDLVYLAIDGLAPFAKIVQQRSRRFVSAWRRSQREDLGWDTNAITPGTAFMASLGEALNERALETDRACEIEVSTSEDRGEGETKIFERLSATAGDVVDVVYGADGDLLLRALLAFDPDTGRKIYVLRDEREGTLVVNVASLHAAISRDMCNGAAGVTDYVFLMELIGNDFVPQLSYLNDKRFAVPFLIALYQKHVVRKGQVLVRREEKRWKADWRLMADIVRDIAAQEDARFHVSHERFYGLIGSGHVRPDERMDNLPMYDKLPREGFIAPRQPGWRRGYYFYLLGFRDHVAQCQCACLTYMQGLFWMFEYYFNHQRDREEADGWCYPHAYSPTARDLSIFLDDCIDRGTLHDQVFAPAMHLKMPTRDTQFQLLLVLPPQSSHLLPERLRPIVRDPCMGCVAFYPTTFRIHTYLKRYLWECHPLLPKLDLDLLYSRFTTSS
jgi:5'-3' exonuclease